MLRKQDQHWPMWTEKRSFPETFNDAVNCNTGESHKDFIYRADTNQVEKNPVVGHTDSLLRLCNSKSRRRPRTTAQKSPD